MNRIDKENIYHIVTMLILLGVLIYFIPQSQATQKTKTIRSSGRFEISNK